MVQHVFGYSTMLAESSSRRRDLVCHKQPHNFFRCLNYA